MSQYDYHTRNHPELNKTPPNIRPNDLRSISLWKQDGDDTPIGLVLEKKSGTKEYYVKEITDGGLLQQRHKDSIAVGDRIIKLNDKPIEEEFTSNWDVNNYIKKQTKLKLNIYRTGFHLAQEQNPWGKPEYSVGNTPSKSAVHNATVVADGPAIPPLPNKYSPNKSEQATTTSATTGTKIPTSPSPQRDPETKQEQKQPTGGTTGGQGGENAACCVIS